MTYYVAMRCAVVGPDEAVTRFRELVFREDHQVYPGEIMFDFNQVKPIPEFGRAEMPGFMKVIEARLPREIMAFRVAEEIRRATQIWCDTNWGAFSCGHEISFKSEQPLDFTMNARAGFPEPIFVRLAELFPELSFECAFHGFYDMPDDCSYLAHLDGDDRGRGGRGWFNPPSGKPAFKYGVATDAIIEHIGRDKSVRRWAAEDDF